MAAPKPTDDVQTTEARTLMQRLIAAQSEIGNVTKNAENNFFKNAKGKASKFVDLAALNDAVIPALNKHGLFLTQRVEMKATRVTSDRELVPVLVTQIYAETGEALAPSEYPIIAKDLEDPQKFGAGVTYARRYALMAYLGIAAEDDDGNTAAQPKPNPARELAEALKGTGIDTKEKLAEAMKKRYDDTRTSLTQLSATEVKAWLSELQNPVPF